MNYMDVIPTGRVKRMDDKFRLPPDEPDGHGGLRVARTWYVSGEPKIVYCCGCGFPVDQLNPRCLVMDPDEMMGTYGPCCAPRGRNLAGARRRWEQMIKAVAEHAQSMREEANRG